MKAMGLTPNEHQLRLARKLSPAALTAALGGKPRDGVLMRFWVEWTKGAGKDLFIALLFVWLVAFARRFLDMQIGAADRAQAGDFLKWARQIVSVCHLEDLVEIQSYAIVSLNPKTRSICDVVAADLHGSHGARPSVLCVNECSHIAKTEFVQTLLDNASKVSDGLVLIFTNAGFKNSFAWDLREVARQSERWVFDQFARPAPQIPAKEMEEAEKRNPPMRFRRLFWGDWSDASSDMLPSDLIDAAITQTGPMTGQEPGWDFVMGIDLGVRHDRSALVVLGANAMLHRVRVAHLQSWRPKPGIDVKLEAVVNAVVAANVRFRPVVTIFDPNQARLLAELCRKAGVFMEEQKFGPGAMAQAAQATLEAFVDRRIDLYRHPELIADLKALTIEERPFGARIVAPTSATGHCDLGIALCTCALPRALAMASFGFTGTMQSPTFADPRRDDPARFGVQVHSVAPGVARSSVRFCGGDFGPRFQR